MDMVVGSVERASEGPWDLPEGWAWAQLGDVASVNPSTNFDALNAASEIPFIPMAAVAEETGSIDLSKRRKVQEVSKGYVKFMEGDVIFAKITPCMENGKVAPVVGLPGRYAAGSTEFHVFRPVSVDQRFLWYWLVGRGFRGKAKRNMSGSAGQLRVPVDYLRESGFPLAPLAEQKRIVREVDELFAQVAEGEAALKAARKGLDTFRRALLKAAVTGELTKDWRENNPGGETGDELLTRIRAERAAKGQTKGRGKRAADAPPLDTAALPQLPKGWAWGTLGEILLGIEAGLNVSAEGRPPVDGETGIVKVSAVTWGEFDQLASKALPPSAKINARDLIEVGDFLFSRANTLELVGAPVIVKSINKRLVLSDKILRFRLAPGTEHWLEIVLKSVFGRQQIESRATGAQLSMRNISQDSIRALPIPIPPPLEAAEILRRVSEALVASADTLAMLDAEAADAARLKQAILKCAFEGRLVPQDPADEPASAMLARLKVNPSAATPARRGPKKRDA